MTNTLYFWQDEGRKYAVEKFEYNETTKVLRLYDIYGKAIVDIGFAERMPDLSTFTDEEINEYLLDFFEQYTCVEVG